MKKNRQCIIERKTKETDIKLNIDLDNNKKDNNIDTGIGFLDHMLQAFAKLASINLDIQAKGDIYVDSHHTIEDIGIVLGLALKKSLENKNGITRYGQSYIPMDEVLALVCIDISNRSYLVFNANFDGELIGQMPTQMIEEFFRAVAFNSEITLHINVLYGKNDHHIAESIFKAFGMALKMAITINKENPNDILSTKGVI